MVDSDRSELTAPGVLETPSEREQAIAVARQIIASNGLHTAWGPQQLLFLARQYLRALGISENG